MWLLCFAGPFNLKITPDGSSLRISWSISNEVPTIDILGYNIHYTYNGQWKQFGVRKYKQYSFDNLKPRKTYRFKVSACLRNRVKSKCTEEVTFNTECKFSLTSINLPLIYKLNISSKCADFVCFCKNIYTCYFFFCQC